MYAVFAFVPEFVQTAPSAGYGFGVGVTHAGLLILPLSVAMFVLGASTGPLTSRYGGKAVLLVGTVISIVPFVMLAVLNTHQWEIAVAMGLLGAGFGLAFAAMSNLIVEGVSIEQTGVASGMNANIRTVGGSLGAALMSSIVTASAHGGSLPHKSGYTHGFEMLALSAVIGGVAAALVPSKLRHLSRDELDAALPHAELSLVAAGTLVGDDPE
jgi:MFS family permease